MKHKLLLFVLIILLIPLVSAATLKGSIYGSNLELETDVLIEIDNQKYLSKEGTYTFELEVGDYTLTATKGFIATSEEIKVTGTNVFDVFLLDDFTDEDDLWKDTEEQFFTEDVIEDSKYAIWRYILGGLILLALLIRLFWVRKKFGSLSKFRRHHKAENRKTTAEHQEEIDNEPGYLDRVIEIIKKNDGRIHQKTLRKEMLDISESKVSLILTELEHKGKIERIKKGRGKVIILK
ncbi:hypothetical protein HOA91_06335 [Candidatus Woesearchaeota archaeon]|jgi:uncharacterized membrane protein|nr:hypothetical protein [Candidatus Woesearchaeota archaeon]